MKQAGIDPEGTNEPAPGAECYSQIFQGNLILENGVIHEAGPDVKINHAEDNNSGNDNQNGPKVQNVDKGDEKQDENNKNAAKHGSTAIIPTRCKNYADVCCGILRAKLSAVEFIRSVVMKIVRDHVNKYVGGSATPTEEKQQNKPAPAPKEVKGRRR